MPKKVQSQLLVSEVTKDRADALALIRREPRAEVYRLALEGSGLSAMEAVHAEALKKLDELAKGMGMTRTELTRKAVKDGYALSDLEGRKRYPRLQQGVA
jgi:predicted transcriptional regulator